MAKNYDYGSKSIKPWGYFWRFVFYIIPVIGWFFCIVNSLFARNTNVKNHARSFFCAIVFVIVVTILAGAAYGALALLGGGAVAA